MAVPGSTGSTPPEYPLEPGGGEKGEGKGGLRGSVLRAILKGHLPPEGFNLGVLFLLPKKQTGLLSDTRPLSVTNTDNRLLATAVARGIMPAVDGYICPVQKVFWSG